MLDALRYEWTRLSTIRSTAWLLVTCLVLNALLPVLLASLQKGRDIDANTAAMWITGGLGFVPQLPPVPAIIVGILGVFSIGHEFQYGTIRPTMTAIPRRNILIGAKVITISLVALVISWVSMLINGIAVALIVGKALPLNGEFGALIGFTILMVGWGVLGFSVTLLGRQVWSALVFLFSMPLLVENVIRGLLALERFDKIKWMVNYLPFSAGTALTRGSKQPDLMLASNTLTRGEYGLVFVSFVLILLGLAWWRFNDRDA